MLEVAHLSFDYPGRRALEDVSFVLPASSITALVGPNGAGKSTLMRNIAGLARPSEGHVRLLGEDVHVDPRKAHGVMGFLPDFFGLYNELTVERCLLYRARAQNVKPEQISMAIEKAARRVQLTDRLKDKASTLSRGMRQRLAIAQAIIHQPSLLILDEPASGLDPVARAELSQLLLDLRRDGMTILVSSHILSELEDYSTHLLALDQGRILTHEALTNSEAGGNDKLQLQMTLLQMSDEFHRQLASHPFVSGIEIEEKTARFHFIGNEKDQAALLKDCVAAGFPISSYSMRRESLRKTYLNKIKKDNK